MGKIIFENLPSTSTPINADNLNGIQDNILDSLGLNTNTYNSEKTYNTNDITIYDNALYKCNADNTTGEWDNSKWDFISLIDKMSNDMYYKTGDIYTISGQVYLGGALTSSSKSVLFTIFLPKRLDNINSISVSGLNMAVRLTSGGYWANGDIADANVTVASFTNNYVTITIESSTASGTNNTPCNVYIRRLTLTFN